MLAILWLTMTIDGKIAVTAPLRMTTNENLTTTMARRDVPQAYVLAVAAGVGAQVQVLLQAPLGETMTSVAIPRQTALAWVATVPPKLVVDTIFALWEVAMGSKTTALYRRLPQKSQQLLDQILATRMMIYNEFMISLTKD